MAAVTLNANYQLNISCSNLLNTTKQSVKRVFIFKLILSAEYSTKFRDCLRW